MATNIGWQWSINSLVITSTNLISFYGASYGDPIKIGSYNQSTHIRQSVTEDVQIDTGSNTIHNFAYVSDTEVSVNGSFPMVLSGSTPTSGGFRIRLWDSGNAWAFKVIGVKIYAFSGTDLTVPVPGVEIYMFEFGESHWNRLYGSSNPATLTPALTPATSHSWDIGLSIKPIDIIQKTATIRLEADIQ